MGNILKQAEQFAYRIANGPVVTLPTHVVYHHRQDPIEGAGTEGWNVDELIDSFSKKGVQNPVNLMTDGNYGYLEDGNHRVQAADQLGLPHMPVRLQRIPYAGADEHARILHPHLRKLLDDHPEVLG